VSRCNAASGPNSGEFAAPCKGTLWLVWNNAFSYLTGKTVHLHLQLASPLEEGGAMAESGADGGYGGSGSNGGSSSGSGVEDPGASVTVGGRKVTKVVDL
jgi:hypothetical protein